MDPEARKTALRMIPYGLYVLSSQSDHAGLAAATVNWVTQASFEPPLLAVAVKVDSKPYAVIQEARAFALSVLGKDQGAIAYAFFKPVERQGNKIAGQSVVEGKTGSPILEAAPAFVDCELRDTLAGGDHALLLGEVVDAGVRQQPEGRPDEATLWLKDLGAKVFYGG